MTANPYPFGPPWYHGRTIQTFQLQCPECEGGVSEALLGFEVMNPPAVRIGYLTGSDTHGLPSWELLRCLPCERCGWEMPAADAEALTATIADELARGIDRRD